VRSARLNYFQHVYTGNRLLSDNRIS